jgi:biopolymer transport protein ExbB/TolQ
MRFAAYDLWRSMGPVARGVVFVLGGMSIVALSIGLDRALALLRFRRAGRRWAQAATPAIDAGKFEDALATTGEGPLPRVVSSGVKAHLDARARAPSALEALAAVEAALDRAVDGERALLRRGLSTLATIGSTSPFIGLFGTIVGIVDAFRQIAKTGAGGLGAVSAGIAEALVTTALGILVAVVAVVLFNFLSGRIEAVETDLADATGAVLERVRQAHWAREKS